MSAFRQGSGDVFGPVGAVAGNIPVFDGATGKIIKDGGISPSVVTAMPRGHLAGLGMANNATDAVNDIDISEGQCRDSTNSVDIVLPAGITKRLDAAWTVGTDQGGLDTGVITNATYHVYLIKRSDTGVVDALFSLSANAPTLPANYTHFRRTGSILRVGAVIVPFSQSGDTFLRMVPIQDVNLSNLGTTAVLYTLSVPTGINVTALGSLRVSNAAIWDALVTSPDQTDSAVTSVLNTMRNVGGVIDNMGMLIRTNTSAQIRARADVASTSLFVTTTGWIDTRGKDS